MADITRIIALIDKYLESTGLNRVEANEISIYLEKNGVLSHSTKGQSLRKLLREGRIPNAEQVGGKGTSWYIRHSNSKSAVVSKQIQKLKQSSFIKETSSAALTDGLEPVADSDAQILILGTLPGKVSLQTQQYYANRTNQFWKIISRIFNDTMSDSYEERLNVLKRHHIALWDVLKSANRESSLDSDIKNPIANDILGFISKHPKLRVIGLNGRDAESYFNTYIGAHNLPENIRVVSLPSSSSTNTHFTIEDKIELWKTILK
ncbi:MAG: DNA-deoxyinosine glycosylase [Bacteroides sp.]|nr:DNA-deoxyinosine glycosylase [Bacteroides sp.]